MTSQTAKWMLPLFGGMLALAAENFSRSSEPEGETVQASHTEVLPEWSLVGRIAPQDVAPGEVERLVRELGAPAFQVRQRASERLREIGLPALMALRAATHSEQLEQRLRAERLVRTIELATFSRSVRQFVESGTFPGGCTFPGWETYHREIGDDVAAREIFAAMVSSEPELMWHLDRSPVEISRLVDERCTDIVLISQFVAPAGGQSTTPSVGTACALLFAASVAEVRTNYYTSNCLNNLILMHELGVLLNEGSPQREPLRRLIGMWIKRCEVATPMQRLSLAARFDLPEGLDAALEMIHSRVGGRQLQYAIFFVAKTGGPDHIPLLEEMLRDETELDSRRYGDNVICSTRVQDVALVAILHITGQNPEDYGFDKLRPNSQFLYQPDSAGFESEEARQTAFRSWWRWRADNLREVFPAPQLATEGIAL